MPAKFRAADATIRWSGTDDTTPPGHIAAVGADSVGAVWLWLFKGEQPTEDTFVGSISIPHAANQAPTAYGRGGGFAGIVTDTKTALAKLADRAKNEA